MATKAEEQDFQARPKVKERGSTGIFTQRQKARQAKKDFEAGKGKEKGKGRHLGFQLCWMCGRPGHLSQARPNRRANALEEPEALQDSTWVAEESENLARLDDSVCKDA